MLLPLVIHVESFEKLKTKALPNYLRYGLCANEYGCRHKSRINALVVRELIMDNLKCKFDFLEINVGQKFMDTPKVPGPKLRFQLSFFDLELYF